MKKKVTREREKKGCYAMRAACALLANVTFCVCARAESFFFSSARRVF